TLIDVNINKLYQRWRSFAAIINKCLTGKSSGYDSLRLSQAQILWGLYHKRNVDYAYLMWEDFVYQVEHKNSKKSNEMYYPWFTKNTQQFSALLPIELTNEEIRNSNAYKEYYAIATGAAAGPRLATSAKGKQAAKASKAKSLFALSENSTEDEGDDEGKDGDGDDDDNGDDGEEGDGDDDDEDDDDEEGDDDDQEVEKDDEKDDEEEGKQGMRKVLILSRKILKTVMMKQSSSVSSQCVTSMLSLTFDVVAIQIQSDCLRDEAQKENDEFLKTVDENMQKIIKEQVKEQVQVQVSKILPRIEQTMNEKLEAEVLTRSSHLLKTSYAVVVDL
nr:hypothetical protein [Tanacetum cinerariifolium]